MACTRSPPLRQHGVFHYPMDRAAQVALGAIREFCEGRPGLDEVRVVLFGRAALKVYEEALADLRAAEALP